MIEAIIFIFSLIFGSFLNVVIYRLPRGKSVVWGRSYCPVCQKTLIWCDMVPVVSYLVLRGRCRYCKSPIGWRYPVVEIFTASLFLIIFYRYGASLPALKYLFLVVLLIVASFIDLEHYIIPDTLTATGFAGGIILNLLAQDISFASALAGMSITGGFFLLLSLISKGGMGGGDVKMVAVTGLFLGWPLGLLGAFFGCCLAGLAGIGLIITQRKSRKDIMPFAPFMATGALLALLAGWPVIEWYVFRFLK